MTNLGNVDLGDGIRLKTELTNLSSVVADATIIKVSIVDDSNVVRINKSTPSKVTTGTYQEDIYLNPVVFGVGLHHAIWTGFTTNISCNTSFYHEDTFYIEENRLV